MSRTIYNKEVFRVDRFNTPQGKDRNEHVRRYISVDGANRAFEAGARRFLKDLSADGVNAPEAAHKSMCSAMSRYASDPRYGKAVRVGSIITNRRAKPGEVFGHNEFYDPIPTGYEWALELTGGWSWFVPAMRRLNATISDEVFQALSDDFDEFVRQSKDASLMTFRREEATTQASRTAAIIVLLAPDRATKAHKQLAAKWPSSIF